MYFRFVEIYVFIISMPITTLNEWMVFSVAFAHGSVCLRLVEYLYI